MSKDILSGFGPESRGSEAARATNGGKMEVKEIPYSPPQGPTSQMQQGVGLHGTNHGNAVCQGKH